MFRSTATIQPKWKPRCAAGAELVLSVCAENREAAPDWGCEVVVIPEMYCDEGMTRFHETIDYLASKNVRQRLDPVLNPLALGFTRSLGRYIETRRRYPDLEMMMGIGNVTELVDADSAAINVLLLSLCEELGIHSVLTTEVVHWAQSSVRECDLARRLAYYAVNQRTLPKHLEPSLIPLRGQKPARHGSGELDRLGAEIKDNNYRLFSDEGKLHIVSAGMHLSGGDPFLLFEELLARNPKNIDVGHAFYLGYELAKAVTALTLDKEYQQDEPLNWGFLTRPEVSHRLRRHPPESHGAASAESH